MSGYKQHIHVLFSTSYSSLTAGECGRFLAWLEHVRFKATLKNKSSLAFFFSSTFSTVNPILKQKHSNVYLNHQRRSSDITPVTYPTITFRTDVQLKKRMGGMSADTAAESCCVSSNAHTQFPNNYEEGLGKELEMANRVSGPRSHYSLNTLRIMKLGQWRAEMENCAVRVHSAIAHFCLNP